MHLRGGSTMSDGCLRWVCGAAIWLAPMAAAGGGETAFADLAVLDGVVLTMDPARPDAEALAVTGKRISAVGSSETIRRLIGPQTLVIRGRGRAVVPAFHDAARPAAAAFDALVPCGHPPRRTTADAIAAWRQGAACEACLERDKGALQVGKLADFMVLSVDPRIVSDDGLEQLTVEARVADGAVRYARTPPLLGGSPRFRGEGELPPGQQLIGVLGRGPASENSGIVSSRTRDDLFWMHNDSGDEPRLYPVRRDGTVYGSSREPSQAGVLLGGAINVDWEDVTALSDGTLVVADVGNNGNDRRDLMLYLIDEPSPSASRAAWRRRVFVQYPDQREFPPPRTNFNFDCEAVVAIADRIYLFTKHRSDTKTKVYRLDDFSEGVRHPLRLLQEFDIRGQAVAADALPDGSKLVLATYEQLWLFDVKDVDRPLDWPIGRLAIEGEQIEAVCFDGPDRVLMADEATAKLYAAPVSAFTPVAAAP